MPHSGGGGSHGGGSHGGSHGGSSSRRSSHYFPGSRRYRRHYHDGRPDEYFYTNGVPRKSGLSSVITVIVFGAFFVGMIITSLLLSAPKRLNEEYQAPRNRVIDNIDVIDNDQELEDLLEDYNDLTGICPVVYTMCIEEYENTYADLESFAYFKYVNEYSDEQHVLIVYAIPASQVDDYRAGRIDIPDYEWEWMVGDDTDKIIGSGNEDSFTHDMQRALEDGDNPGEAIEFAMNKLYTKNEKSLNRNPLLSTALFPVIITAGIFIFIAVALIKNYKNEKNFEYEEVPLDKDDVASDGKTGSSTLNYNQIPSNVNVNGASMTVATIMKIIMIIFLAPFFIVGLVMIVSGIASLKSGDGPAILIFGLVWTSIIVVVLGSMIRSFRKIKKTDAPMTADYPSAEYPKADYPKFDYPEQTKPETKKVSFFGGGLKTDDEDDNSLDGYE